MAVYPESFSSIAQKSGLGNPPTPTAATPSRFLKILSISLFHREIDREERVRFVQVWSEAIVGKNIMNRINCYLLRPFLMKKFELFFEKPTIVKLKLKIKITMKLKETSKNKLSFAKNAPCDYTLSRSSYDSKISSQFTIKDITLCPSAALLPRLSNISKCANVSIE